MPTYEYICEENPDHVTEQKGGLDDDTIECPQMEVLKETGAKYPCTAIARRRPGYPSQGVIFSGTGFTRTVIPPAPPKTTTVSGEPVADWFEKTDEYAERQYKDDEHYREHRKDQAKKMVEQVKRGALT